MINVTPPERRDHARAFLNGVPTQVGTALAGLLLIVGQTTLQPRQLYVIGFGAAVLTALTMWQAKRSYAAAVAETLRSGRPHVFEDYEGSLSRASANAAPPSRWPWPVSRTSIRGCAG